MMFDATRAGQCRSQLDEIVIDTPRYQELVTKLNILMAHAEARHDEPKRCVLLVGPSQSGKSTMIKSFAKSLNTADALARHEIPVLHVTLMANITRKQAMKNILSAFEKYGYEDVSKDGDEAELTIRVCKYLRTGRIKLLVLDEFHHVVHSESNKIAHSVGEAIKWLLIEGACPILMAGTVEAQKPFASNKQLAKRAEPPIVLAPLDLKNPNDHEVYLKFLSRFVIQVERTGWAINARTLFMPEYAGPIHQASGGVLGDACNLIKAAIQNAAGEGRDSVGISDLAKANDGMISLGLCSENYFHKMAHTAEA